MKLDWLYNTFWNERIWLPPNVTWLDLENKPDDPIVKPRATDLWLTLPLAVVIYCIRLFVVNVVAVKLGAYFNIRKSSVKVTVERNTFLESKYKRLKRPGKNQLDVIASEANLRPEQVSNWFRARRNFDKASKLDRLQDSLWKFLYYGAVWIFGMYQFSTRHWAKDVRDCWNGFPNHHLDDATKWFYLVQIAFYVMCAVTHFSDVRRKDFWAMLIHHFVTIGLMSASYINNHVRIGCLILITHDIADVNMEFAKTINYLGYTNASQYAFVAFVICWIVTRLTYYPLVLVRSVIFDLPEIVGVGYHFLNFFIVLLLGLLVLHIYWFTLIVRMVIMQVKRGRVDGDVRSDSEIDTPDENANDVGKKNKQSSDSAQLNSKKAQ